MSSFWSPIVHDLQPYIPGEQPQNSDIVKLNTNESPYGPSTAVINAIKQHANSDLKRYPDPESHELKKVISRHFNLLPSNIFLGNGSDEVLAFIFRALFNPRYPILFPDITYSFYPVYATLYELPYKTIALNASYQINVADYYSTPTNTNGGIIIANPNAPTGIALPLDDIESLLYYNPESTVVIDEAYVDFGAESAVSLINRYPNLVVVQTLSKSRSLAGLRVGYALAQEQMIEGLSRVKNSFNSYPLDRLAQVAATASFKDNDYFNSTCQRIINGRQRLAVELERLGFNVLPSKTNFLLVSHPQYASAPDYAERLFTQLKQKNILIRYFTHHPALRQFMRITVGTEQQNQILVKALTSIINQ